MGEVILGYFDPGSGSILLQVIVGGFAGGLLLLRHAWDRIRQMISGPRVAEQSNADWAVSDHSQ